MYSGICQHCRGSGEDLDNARNDNECWWCNGTGLARDVPRQERTRVGKPPDRFYAPFTERRRGGSKIRNQAGLRGR